MHSDTLSLSLYNYDMPKSSKPARRSQRVPGSTLSLERCSDCRRRYRAQVIRADGRRYVSLHDCR